MKKSLSIAKTLMIAFVSVSMVAFVSCNKLNLGSKDEWAYLVNETSHDVQLNGNTLTYGTHVYTVNGEIDHESTVHNTPTAYVTFTNVPSGYTEFEAVYKNLLGKSQQGVAAMIPMAFEIYARNNATGEKCLNLLCNGSATVSEIVRILKTKLVPSEYSPENDQYIQRYMPAALLKGANRMNAYQPDEPFTVEMCSSVNAPQESQFSGGWVYSLYIIAQGWDTQQRAVQVLQPYGSEYYKVFSCPATYSQCQTIIGTWQGLK